MLGSLWAGSDSRTNAGQLPHVVLLDVHMPVMDGPEFRAHQKADPELAGIPVVAITSDWEAHLDADATLKTT